jgi:protein SCO1/2
VWLAAACACVWLADGAAARAQVTAAAPAGLADVGIDEKLGAQLPGELTFRDANGRTVRFSELFDGQRPVLLSLNYSDCPMLCRVQLDGLVQGLRELAWTTGEEFSVVSVSIDPLETPQRARETLQRYVNEYGRPGGGAGWQFLVGDAANIRQLADTVGFRYKYIPETKEYSHAAAVMVCTPEGTLSRYLYGVAFDEQTLRLALVEAGEGKIGSTLDQILLYCFHYDAEKGRYGPTARFVMQLAAGATVLGLTAALLPVWLRRHAARREASPEVNDSASVGPQP